MAEFTYEAITSSGARNKGSLVATSEREVMTMLDARGLFPVRIAPIKAATVGGLQFGHRVRPRYVAGFFSQLADLLHSGVPLLRSLEILERQTTKPALAAVLREIHASVADGNGLAEAMSHHPKAFTELSVSMVRAGQEGGFLEDVLRRIADFMEHQEDLKGKVIGALVYPVLLIVLGALILNILVIFFIPQFEPLFKKLEEKGQLPTLTVVLVALSHGMQRLAIPFVVFIVLAVLARLTWSSMKRASTDLGLGELVLPTTALTMCAIVAVAAYALLCPAKLRVMPGEALTMIVLLGGAAAVYVWARTESGRLALDAFRLKIPKVGSMYLSFALSRFARILSTMLHNGIPILNALRISKDSAGNRVLANAIDKAADNVTAGQSLAGPLSECPYFPRDVVAIIAVGEESNNLEKVLMDIAETSERRTSRELDLFVRLLEPALLVVMGVVVLIVVSGLLMPVFKMSEAVR
jgi:general secretion pathway protein F